MGPTAKSVDPSGSYIATWVPELRGLPRKVIREPWKATADELAGAGVVLGSTYPHRIPSAVDIAAAKGRNLSAVRELREKAKSAGYVDGDGYDLVKPPPGSCRGSTGKLIRVFTKPEFRGKPRGKDGGSERRRAKGKAGNKYRGGKKKGGKVHTQGSKKVAALRQITMEEALKRLSES